MKLQIHVDGGARGNPGPAGAGVVIRDQDTRRILHEAGYYLGRTTNNCAEYEGLCRALAWAQRAGAGDVSVCSDSQLLVRQITGQYRVKSPGLKPLYAKATGLLDRFDKWRIDHVYRHHNQRADELANMAMDAGRDVIVGDTHEEHGGRTEPLMSEPDPRTPTVEPWGTVGLAERPGPECPAPTAWDQRLPFGPTTPGGMCVFAAGSVCEAVSGADQEPTRSQPLRCGHCGVRINFERTAGAGVQSGSL